MSQSLAPRTQSWWVLPCHFAVISTLGPLWFWPDPTLMIHVCS